MMKNLNRRRFLKQSGLGSAAMAITPAIPPIWSPPSEKNQIYMGDFKTAPIARVKMAFIGVGNRGFIHAQQWAQIEGTEIVAVCDVFEDLVEKTILECKQQVDGNRHQNIAAYSGNAL